MSPTMTRDAFAQELASLYTTAEKIAREGRQIAEKQLELAQSREQLIRSLELWPYEIQQRVLEGLEEVRKGGPKKGFWRIPSFVEAVQELGPLTKDELIEKLQALKPTAPLHAVEKLVDKYTSVEKGKHVLNADGKANLRLDRKTVAA